ncbi:hypothetical protein ACWGIV_14005 [Streptomyces sp. NPDC054844]
MPTLPALLAEHRVAGPSPTTELAHTFQAGVSPVNYQVSTMLVADPAAGTVRRRIACPGNAAAPHP